MSNTVAYPMHNRNQPQTPHTKHHCLPHQTTDPMSNTVSSFIPHLLLITFFRLQYGTGWNQFFFYNLAFTLRWLIQQCLSAQHMWLPVTPFVTPLPTPCIIAINHKPHTLNTIAYLIKPQTPWATPLPTPCIIAINHKLHTIAYLIKESMNHKLHTIAYPIKELMNHKETLLPTSSKNQWTTKKQHRFPYQRINEPQRNSIAFLIKESMNHKETPLPTSPKNQSTTKKHHCLPHQTTDPAASLPLAWAAASPGLLQPAQPPSFSGSSGTQGCRLWAWPLSEKAQSQQIGTAHLS